MMVMIAEAATGRLLRKLQTAPENIATNTFEGEIAVEGDCPLSTHWFDGTGLVERPSCPVPAEAVPGTVQVTSCPPGAIARVVDVELGDLLAEAAPDGDGAIELTFPDPAAYRITVSAPFPWLDSTLEVIVA